MKGGEEIPVKPRKKPVPAGCEGSKTRAGCALNELYNMEKQNRIGRFDYYQHYNHEARTVRVGFWCKGVQSRYAP